MDRQACAQRVGISALHGNSPVEVEMILEVE
jgi:hypothetical protein